MTSQQGTAGEERVAGGGTPRAKYLWTFTAAFVVFGLFGALQFAIPALRSAPTTWGLFTGTFGIMLLATWTGQRFNRSGPVD